MGDSGARMYLGRGLGAANRCVPVGQGRFIFSNEPSTDSPRKGKNGGPGGVNTCLSDTPALPYYAVPKLVEGDVAGVLQLLWITPPHRSQQL